MECCKHSFQLGNRLGCALIIVRMNQIVILDGLNYGTLVQNYYFMMTYYNDCDPPIIIN